MGTERTDTPSLTLAQRLFQRPWVVAAYDRMRESPVARITCGLTFRAEVAIHAAALRRAPGRRFIEIACGQGSFGIGVARQIPDVRFAALDLSAAQFARAGRKVAAAGVADRYRRIRGDALRLPFLEGVFDGALCVGGFHQIPEPRRALAEAGRVLRPGGILAGSCFHLRPTLTSPFGMNALEPGEFAGWLRDAGFTRISCRKTGPIWFVFDAERG